MDALTALQQRSSAPRLTEPVPGPEALDNIFRAGLRPADHGLLQPWRFLLIRGESRDRLGELFVQALLDDDPETPTEKLESMRRKPLRAPLIVVTVSSLKQHPTVPPIEQEFSAAAATQNMLVAAYAQGVGAMWRTGAMAYHATVMAGLGLTEQEKIMGFLYLGTPAGPQRPPQSPDPDSFFKDW